MWYTNKEVHYVQVEILLKEHIWIEDYGVFKVWSWVFWLNYISEIAYNYVFNINKYVKLNEEIYAYVIDVDTQNKHLKLSIKNINHNFGNDKVKVKESIRGFLPLHDALPKWVDEKLKELE